MGEFSRARYITGLIILHLGCSVLCETDVGAALEGLGIDAAREDIHFLMEVSRILASTPVLPHREC